MNGGFGWSSAAKIAWRESRASSVKFAFVILAVAVGVGSLTGVRGFSSAFRTMLAREARTLMAADVTARVFVMPDPAQEAVLKDLEAKGVRRTWVTETVTMVSSSKASAPVLVSAKAVDPSVYPFYGEIKFEPAGRIADVLTLDTVALSEDLMLRLNVQAGDILRVGAQDYRVAGAVVNEPDRMSGSLNVGPRLMMTREGMERAGLISDGSRAAQRFLFKLDGPNPPNVAEVVRTLRNGFPGARVIDYRETHPIVTRGLDRSTMFLSLVSLIALIVGALGVATAMHSHLQQKMDSIAVMKCLGARSHQIIRIYLVQTLSLGLAGALLGVAVGGGVQLAFPHLINRYFDLQPGFHWDWSSIAQGLAAAVLSTLLFTLPPLLSIRRIRPNLILRREMPDARAGWRARWRDNKASIGSAALILTGVAALAAWLSGGDWDDAARLGAYFAGGVSISLLLLSGVAWLLLASLKRLMRNSALRLPQSLRHGVANLYRPGNQAQAVLVALGLGVMFTVTIYLVQRSMLEDMAANAPPGMPNVFLVDIQESQRDGLLALLDRQKGVETRIQLIPSLAARLTHIGGTPIERFAEQVSRRFSRPRTVTWSLAKPEHTVILDGAWWGSDSAGMVSVTDDTARFLGLKLGDQLGFTVLGQPVSARVVAFHRTEAVRVGASNDFVFTPATLKGLPVIFYGGMRVRGADVPLLQRAVYDAYPTVTVINVADVIRTIQEVVDQIALVIRFISAFAILAGVIILASSVAGTRFRRIREVVILKTLGGTRRRIGRIFSAEFLILGAVAGLMGALLATGFSNAVLVQFFEGEWRFDVIPVAASIILAALVANAAGWAASARILGQKPLEVLRAE